MSDQYLLNVLNKHEACEYEQEISKQNELISQSFILNFPFLSHRQQAGNEAN